MSIGLILGSVDARQAPDVALKKRSELSINDHVSQHQNGCVKLEKYLQHENIKSDRPAGEIVFQISKIQYKSGDRNHKQQHRASTPNNDHFLIGLLRCAVHWFIPGCSVSLSHGAQFNCDDGSAERNKNHGEAGGSDQPEDVGVDLLEQIFFLADIVQGGEWDFASERVRLAEGDVLKGAGERQNETQHQQTDPVQLTRGNMLVDFFTASDDSALDQRNHSADEDYESVSVLAPRENIIDYFDEDISFDGVGQIENLHECLDQGQEQIRFS